MAYPYRSPPTATAQPFADWACYRVRGGAGFGLVQRVHGRSSGPSADKSSRPTTRGRPRQQRAPVAPRPATTSPPMAMRGCAPATAPPRVLDRQRPRVFLHPALAGSSRRVVPRYDPVGAVGAESTHPCSCCTGACSPLRSRPNSATLVSNMPDGLRMRWRASRNSKPPMAKNSRAMTPTAARR